MKKMFVVLSIGLFALSCGPSPESMAKKTCALYTQYLAAESAGDSASMVKYTTEIGVIETEIKEKHKNNADWLTTYALERDACIIKEAKKNK